MGSYSVVVRGRLGVVWCRGSSQCRGVGLIAVLVRSGSMRTGAFIDAGDD